MFVTVVINSEIPEGTLVCHDTNNVWRQATSQDVAPLGVLTASDIDEEGVRWAQVTLAGVTWARAGTTIPAQGGWLACDDNGRAVVSSTEDCGLIAPLTRGAGTPAVDDIIMIYLR